MAIPVDKDKEFIIWTFDFALSTFYEVETDLIQPLVPPRLSLMEVAPGVCLINVTAFNFPEGALGELPEFQELIFSTIISPDLVRGVPRFAMYVISLGSTCQEHLEHSSDYYKLPVYDQSFNALIKKDDLSAEYGDCHGTIMTMSCSFSNPTYKEEERYFQSFTFKEGTTYVSDVYIKALLFEHQQSGEVGTLHNHPFFFDLDLENAHPVGYLQMINKPETPGQQFYYRPERFG